MLDPDSLLLLFQQMVQIRATEEEICARYGDRNIRGAVHLSIGQEASAVGVLSCCDANDLAISTHRNHAHYLAKGGSLAGMVDELYGLPTGCSGGYGGSMHLSDPAVGFVGASAVLPGSMPIAVGLGFAARVRNDHWIAIAFTGDGAADEGAFFETLNLAAVLPVPVLFVCENNQLSTNTVLAERQAAPDIAAKAAAFGLCIGRANGHDVFDVRQQASAMIDTIRSDRRPGFLEVMLPRLCAHVGPESHVPRLDPMMLFDAAREAQPSDDPVTNALRLILMDAPQLAEQCRAAIEAAVARARGEFERGNSAFVAHNAELRLVRAATTEVVCRMTSTKAPTTYRADYARAMVEATRHILATDARAFVYGEGINDPGAFLSSTRGLGEEFGADRCFDVPNSEESLVGLGVGAALSGLRPIFVNLRLDFLMLAMSQIVNHAARWPAMTGYASSVPLTIHAIVGRSWGQAAQHAGAVYAGLANVPGIDVILPADAAEAGGLFLSAVDSPNVSVIIEERDIYGVEADVPFTLQPISLGEARVVCSGSDVTLVAVSSMVAFASEVASRLRRNGVSAEVIDIRTARPFDAATVNESVQRTGRVVVCDIGWRGFGLASEVSRHLLEAGVTMRAPLYTVARRDEHTPASCFLEYDYYPRVDDVAEHILSDTLQGRSILET